jgi:arabinose-5-phosphate isomerase
VTARARTPVGRRSGRAEQALAGDALWRVLSRKTGPFFLIAGPCVIENPRHPGKVAARLKEITRELGITLVFKASYDKANRSSLGSFRGPGLEQGLEILAGVRAKHGVPILTDVHEVDQVERAAAVADVLQIPAFLCRQTDLVLAAARTGRIVNIKKGQFMAPWDMKGVVEKAATTGNAKIMVTERGFTFGYNDLVVDMRSFPTLRSFGYPVVFDVTHSVQRPGGLGDRSGGDGGGRARPVHGGPREPGASPVGWTQRVPAGAAPEAPAPPARHSRSRAEVTVPGSGSGGYGPASYRPWFRGFRTPGVPSPDMSRETARKVLEVEAQAILGLVPRVGESYDRAVDLLLACTGRVVVTGMGKSGLIAQKISATLSSTGTPSLFLHPAEATHGDLGRIVKGDVLLAVSYSGETEEILALVPWMRRLVSPLIAMTGNPRSSLAAAADVHLDVSISQEACPFGLAPTASTTAALAMGDALAMGLLERRGFTIEDFAVLHPGGRLGKKLLRVEDVMHAGEQAPRVGPETAMKEVLFEMTKKRLGMTTVVDAEGRLVGMISDGDLRRQMERHGYTLLDRTAAQCMTPGPLTVRRRELATSALALLEERKVTSLPVVDEAGRVDGVVHLHDLWKTGMI